MSQLVDSFGRKHRDLRVSLTDVCNLRCSYCMPEEGLQYLDRSLVLSRDEFSRAVEILTNLGIDSVRLTGGEPTLRKDLVGIVSDFAAFDKISDLSLTSNGVLLEPLVDDLVAAGLDRVNISLDTLDAARFREITRRDGLDKTLAAIEACVAAGLSPVKVNVVLMGGVNDDEVIDFLNFSAQQNIVVRFIEFMPLDADGEWSDSVVVDSVSLLNIVSAEYKIEKVVDVGSSSPSVDYYFSCKVSGERLGIFGVIASVSEPFCDSCDRLRLTADGQLRSCLFAGSFLDLRSLLRSSVSDAEIAEAILGEVMAKKAGHGIGTRVFVKPSRSMSQIGG